MTLLLAANRGRIDEQDRESLELIGGSDRKYRCEYETRLIIDRLCYVYIIYIYFVVRYAVI